MSNARAALLKAILEKAMSDPGFREELAVDPIGFLRGLAVERRADPTPPDAWGLRKLAVEVNAHRRPFKHSH